MVQVVGFALNRGTLCRPLTLAQTIAVLGLPVSFEAETKQHLKGTVHPGALAAKLPLLVLVLRAEVHLRHSSGLQSQLLHLLYGGPSPEADEPGGPVASCSHMSKCAQTVQSSARVMHTARPGSAVDFEHHCEASSWCSGDQGNIQGTRNPRKSDRLLPGAKLLWCPGWVAYLFLGIGMDVASAVLLVTADMRIKVAPEAQRWLRAANAAALKPHQTRAASIVAASDTCS